MRVAIAVLLGLSICQAAAGGTFVYTHERSTSNGSRVFGLRVQGTAVSDIGAPPFTTSGVVTADVRGNLGTIAYSPKRKVLFASTSSGIVAMRVAKTGELTEIAGSPFGGSNDFIGLGVAEFRKKVFLFAAGRLTDQIIGFEVAKSGALVDLGQPASTGVGPLQVKVVGNVLATLCSDDDVWVFKVNQNGTLSHDANGFFADPSMGFANSDIAINPNKKTVYMVSDNGGVYPLHVSKAGGAFALTELPFNALMFSNYGAVAMISPRACLIARNVADDADADMFAAHIAADGSVDDSLNLAQSSLLNTIDAFASGPRQHVAVAASDVTDRTYVFGLDNGDGSLGFLDGYGLWFGQAPENFTGAIVITR